MARELDSEMLRRLQKNYGAMSDGELQEMAAKPDDLTDMALEILRGEMTRRRLDVVEPTDGVRAMNSAQSIETAEVRETSESFGGDPFAALEVRPTWGEPENVTERKGWVSLMVFYDAIELGRACDFLDEQEIEFEIHDRSKPASAATPFRRPVEMDVGVRQVDQLEAMAVLREKMGLFPLQEVEVADAPLDDGTVAMLGDFGRREDAEEVARVLEQAGMWHWIVANKEGTVETEDCFRLQVREIDLMVAGELVEKAMNLP